MILKLFDAGGSQIDQFAIDSNASAVLVTGSTAIRFNDKLYVYSDTDGDTFIDFTEADVYELGAGGEPLGGGSTLYGRQIG